MLKQRFWTSEMKEALRLPCKGSPSCDGLGNRAKSRGL